MLAAKVTRLPFPNVSLLLWAIAFLRLAAFLASFF
jgi:hypothetical protein